MWWSQTTYRLFLIANKVFEGGSMEDVQAPWRAGVYEGESKDTELEYKEIELYSGKCDITGIANVIECRVLSTICQGNTGVRWIKIDDNSS